MFICFESQQTSSKEFSVKPLEIYLWHKISVTSALVHFVAVTACGDSTAGAVRSSRYRRWEKGCQQPKWMQGRVKRNPAAEYRLWMRGRDVRQLLGNQWISMPVEIPRWKDIWAHRSADCASNSTSYCITMTVTKHESCDVGCSQNACRHVRSL